MEDEHNIYPSWVIDEIERNGASHNKDDKMTLQYLKALRKVFERGLLCREHVTSMESRVHDRRISLLYRVV